MTFLNGAMLGGLFLVTIPIVIHLSMRRKPKRLVFPALRFVQARNERNQRQLRLRRWILLLMRCLAIACAVILLARPAVALPLVADSILIGLFGTAGLLVGLLAVSVLVTRRGPWLAAVLALADVALLGTAGWLLADVVTRGSSMPIGDARAPLSAVLLVDTSPRMTYVRENEMVFDRAKKVLQQIVATLPADSQLAVMGADAESVFWSTGRRGARQAVDRLVAGRHVGSIPRAVQRAVRLLREGRYERKELYIVTDLTRPSWPESDAATLRDVLQSESDITTYGIDVGVDDPINVWLGSLVPSPQTLAGAGQLQLGVSVDSVGKRGSRTVELYLESIDPRLPLRRDGKPVQPPQELADRTTVELKPGAPVQHVFYLAGLAPGTHHGLVRLREGDPLAADNVRYFTVVVRPPWKMLVSAGPGTSAAAWIEAVAPRELRDRGAAPFQVRSVPPSKLAATPFDETDVVVLLDPPPLPKEAWTRLRQFAEAGGGLIVTLGHNAQTPASFGSDEAAAALGCRISLLFRAQDTFVAPRSYEHPLLKVFQPFASSVPWSEFRVDRHWGVDLATDGETKASVVMRYANGEPFLVEHPLGRGRVLCTTTPVTEVPQPADHRAWNGLAGPDDWPRFVLVNQLAEYAAGARSARWNYVTGEPAEMPQDATGDPTSYQLARPTGPLQIVKPVQGSVRIPWTETPGHYRLKGIDAPTVLRGFSVNYPDTDSDLSRLTLDEVAAFFPSERFQLARDLDELEQQQGSQRVGREFYPYLAVLLAILLGLEQVLADRFYRSRTTLPADPSLASDAAGV